MNKISACIVLFNRWEMSKETAKSLEQTIPSDWEIEWNVIDNGSTDETKNEGVSFFNSLRGYIGHYERLSSPIKAIECANRTINLSSGEYIIRTDNDIRYQRGWFEDCYQIINDPAFFDVGFVCPTHHLRQGNPNYKPTLIKGKVEGVCIDMVSLNRMNVPGNFFAKTSVIKDIGGFYTPYNLLHTDVQYCHTTSLMGYRYGYSWNTDSIHLGVPKGDTEYSQRAIHERRSENQRFEAIAKGDTKDKHPQEIEFVYEMIKMRQAHLKKLPIYKDFNIALVGDSHGYLYDVFNEIYNIPRFQGKFYKIERENYDLDEMIRFCLSHNIRYCFPCDKKSYEFLNKNESSILRQSYAESVIPKTTIDFNGNVSGDITAMMVSSRIHDVVSLVGLSKEGKVVNLLNYFGEFNDISKKYGLFGPWSLVLDRVEDKVVIKDIVPYSNSLLKNCMRIGQNQALISLKILEREFNHMYHYRYLVDWGFNG